VQIEPLVRVQNLTIDRGHHRAIEGVSFDLVRGSHTAIIGPNGAGKSSLVQALVGLIPCQGTIDLPHHLVIGYIPQTFSLPKGFPLSVAEMVSLGGKVSPAKVREALYLVGLDHKSQRPIGVLSGGELKRMLLAYCLVREPQLLILDEAMAGIDRQGAIQFRALLQQLRQLKGFTILEVCHDLKLLEQEVDWIIGINRSVIMAGTPKELLKPDQLAKLYGY
jgi:zinc transport system ATP-binding protein